MKTPALIFMGFLVLAIPCVLGDLDVNAIQGSVTINGLPAPGGTAILILREEDGFRHETVVDGRFIPPFMYGRGQYDTGDLPNLSTGDSITVLLSSSPSLGAAYVQIVPGTTKVDLNFTRDELTVPEVDRATEDAIGDATGNATGNSEDPYPSPFNASASIALPWGSTGQFGNLSFGALNELKEATVQTREDIALAYVKANDRVLFTLGAALDVITETSLALIVVTISAAGTILSMWQAYILLSMLGGFSIVVFLSSNRRWRKRVRENTSVVIRVGSKPFWDSVHE